MTPLDDFSEPSVSTPNAVGGSYDGLAVAQGSIRAAGLAARLCSLLRSQRSRLGSLSVLLLVRFITAGLGFVTTIKIANSLGKAMYGELAYALALGAYGEVIVRCGLNRTLIRDLIHDQDRFDVLVLASIALRVVLFVFVALGLVLWRVAGGGVNTLSWVVVSLVLLKSALSLDLQPVYDAWHQFKRHAAYALVERCLYFACVWTALLVWPGEFGLLWIALATAVSVVFYLIIQYRWAFKRILTRTNASLVTRTALLLLKQNVVMWFATIVGLSFGSLNQILLRHFQSAQELGGYAVAWQLVVVADVFLLNVSRIGNPGAARITRPGTSAAARRRFMVKYIGVMLAVAAPFCLPALICPRLILSMLFRPEYLTAAPIMWLLGVYTLLHAVAIPVSQYVVSARMDKTYLASVMIGGLLTVGLCLLLIPTWSAFGAVLAVLLGHGICIMVYSFAMVRHVARQD
jgi:O-antigen/teichoic acid export membrane protein